MNVEALVDRGLKIRKQMAALKEELEKLEESLVKAAEHGEHVPLEDADREGKQFLARGSSQIVPVVFTADRIVASFRHKSAVHARILGNIEAGNLKTFYKPQTEWQMLLKSGKAFRAKADEILGPAAPAFVTACKALDRHGIPKSDTKIEWDAARDAY